MFERIRKLFRRQKPNILIRPNFERVEPKDPNQRSFLSALQTRLDADFPIRPVNTNQDISEQLLTLQARSRDLFKNTSLIPAYLFVMQKNIIGSEGIQLRSKAMDLNGVADNFAQRTITQQWLEFSKNPTTSENQTMKEALRTIVSNLVIDGESVIMIHEGFNNEANIAFQILDATHLDADFNADLKGGKKVIAGIEINSLGKPLAYYFRNPTPLLGFESQQTQRVRITANKIIHLFKKDLSNQIRGFPPTSAILIDIKRLNDFIKFSVLASREGSAQSGFILDEQGTFSGDKQGNYQLSPGQINILNKGQSFQPYTPQHPNTNFADFVKSTQKQIASALGISYNYLINDFESTNFSSLKQSSRSDFETYKLYQDLIVSGFLNPLFEQWLSIQILNRNLNLPFSKLTKFKNVTWIPKRQGEIDALKEANANKTKLENGLTSKTRILAEQGIDFEDILNERLKEKELEQNAGMIPEENLEEEVQEIDRNSQSGHEDEDDNDKASDSNTPENPNQTIS